MVTYEPSKENKQQCDIIHASLSRAIGTSKELKKLYHYPHLTNLAVVITGGLSPLGVFTSTNPRIPFYNPKKREPVPEEFQGYSYDDLLEGIGTWVYQYSWKNDIRIAEDVATNVATAVLDDLIQRKHVVVRQPAEGPAQVAHEQADSVIAVAGSLDDAIRELRSLIGLERVKSDVEELINFIKVQKLRESKGLPNSPISRHLVFYGNPGTGKTSVARILAKVYKVLGVLTSGHLKEVDRAGLVAGYLGQTALKVQEVVSEAIGGVLFIDEAYSLVEQGEDSYGKEAIDTLVKMMEDNRANLIVIVAGYPEKMSRFINSNPGLQSRFNKYFHFDDYKPAELYAIFESFCGASYALTADAATAVRTLFDHVYASRNENFGNARDVRNIFERVISNQASRIVRLGDVDDRALMEISELDIQPILSVVTAGGTTESGLADRQVMS